MPKVTIYPQQRIWEFPEGGFQVFEDKLWCPFCQEFVDFMKKCVIKAHVVSRKHSKCREKQQQAIEVEAKLIRAVEKNRCIWDKEEKKHHSRPLIDEVWENVGIEIGKTTNQARQMWRTLFSKFQRIYNKATVGQKSVEDQAAALGSIEWPHFDSMLFLKFVVAHTEFVIQGDDLRDKEEVEICTSEFDTDDDEDSIDYYAEEEENEEIAIAADYVLELKNEAKTDMMHVEMFDIIGDETITASGIVTSVSTTPPLPPPPPPRRQRSIITTSPASDTSIARVPWTRSRSGIRCPKRDFVEAEDMIRRRESRESVTSATSTISIRSSSTPPPPPPLPPVPPALDINLDAESTPSCSGHRDSRRSHDQKLETPSEDSGKHPGILKNSDIAEKTEDHIDRFGHYLVDLIREVPKDKQRNCMRAINQLVEKYLI